MIPSINMPHSRKKHSRGLRKESATSPATVTNVWTERQNFVESATPRSEKEEEEMLIAALEQSRLEAEEDLAKALDEPKTISFLEKEYSWKPINIEEKKTRIHNNQDFAEDLFDPKCNSVKEKDYSWISTYIEGKETKTPCDQDDLAKELTDPKSNSVQEKDYSRFSTYSEGNKTKPNSDGDDLAKELYDPTSNSGHGKEYSWNLTNIEGKETRSLSPDFPFLCNATTPMLRTSVSYRDKLLNIPKSKPETLSLCNGLPQTSFSDNLTCTGVRPKVSASSITESDAKVSEESVKSPPVNLEYTTCNRTFSNRSAALPESQSHQQNFAKYTTCNSMFSNRSAALPESQSHQQNFAKYTTCNSMFSNRSAALPESQSHQQNVLYEYLAGIPSRESSCSIEAKNPTSVLKFESMKERTSAEKDFPTKSIDVEAKLDNQRCKNDRSTLTSTGVRGLKHSVYHNENTIIPVVGKSSLAANSNCAVLRGRSRGRGIGIRLKPKAMVSIKDVQYEQPLKTMKQTFSRDSSVDSALSEEDTRKHKDEILKLTKSSDGPSAIYDRMVTDAKLKHSNSRSFIGYNDLYTPVMPGYFMQTPGLGMMNFGYPGPIMQYPYNCGMLPLHTLAPPGISGNWQIPSSAYIPPMSPGTMGMVPMPVQGVVMPLPALAQLKFDRNLSLGQ